MSYNAIHDALRGISACFSYALVAEGTNPNTLKTTNAVNYAINGIMYTKAATDNIAFTAGHTALAAGETCLFAVCLDASGNFSTIQGEIVTTADLAGGLVGLPWPTSVDGKVPVGFLRVQTNNAATFTPGSTDLGAADVVDTYLQAAGWPVTPLTA